MSLPEALQIIKQKFQAESPITNLQVTRERVSYEISGTKYSSRFDVIQQIIVVGDSATIYYCTRGAPEGDGSFVFCDWKSQNDAQSFADAVMAMRHYSSSQYLADKATDEAKADADFQEKAKAWRALPQKPKIPEKIRRFRILAEDATESKDFEKAVDYYEQGLAIEPMWPVGQFNAAIIYGELKDYDRAIIHMKRYLELEPNAKDNRACQDKIYLWEGKIGEGNANHQ
jgi:tetratricopeptide (TPR) repeat protein